MMQFPGVNQSYHEQNKMYQDHEEDINGDEQYNDREIARTEYQLQFEVPFVPNIVRWVNKNYLKGEQYTVLIGGYDHCKKYYLKTLIYGKNEHEQIIEINEDDEINLISQISDIQFADDHTAVIALRNGQIQLIQLQQNDINNNHNHINDDDDDEKKENVLKNKWNLIPITSNNESLTCYPDNNKNKYPANLTSIAVSTICGNIVAADECGYIYITDIDQQKTVNCQSCSSSSINCIGFANNDTIASVTMSGQLMLWDIRDLNHVCYSTTLPRKYGSLTSLAVHPNRNRIFATGTEYGSIALWDIRNNKNNVNDDENDNMNEYKIFDGHRVNTLVNDVKFLTNNLSSMNGLVSCGNDGKTQMIQTNKGDDWKNLYNSDITIIQQERYPVTNLDFYEHLGIVATCSDANNISFYPI